MLELDFVWKKAFNLQRSSVPWLWCTDTYERFTIAEKLQANIFVCSRCEVLGGFHCRSKVGYPFGKALLIFLFPLASNSRFLAFLVELVCWDKIRHPSVVLNTISSSAMLKTAGCSWFGGWITGR